MLDISYSIVFIQTLRCILSHRKNNTYLLIKKNLLLNFPFLKFITKCFYEHDLKVQISTHEVQLSMSWINDNEHKFQIGINTIIFFVYKIFNLIWIPFPRSKHVNSSSMPIPTIGDISFRFHDGNNQGYLLRQDTLVLSIYDKCQLHNNWHSKSWYDVTDIIGGRWSDNAVCERGEAFSPLFTADNRRKSFPPPLTNSVVTSSSANKQLHHMRVLSVHRCEQHIFLTLEI